MSVVIPTYNRAAFLREAIDSICAQTFRNWELLVVDDGSSDETHNLVKQLARKDRRIKYLHQSHKGYPAAGLNLALKHVRGQYFYKHDDDDVAAPTLLKECVVALNKAPANYFAVGIRIKYFSTDKTLKIPKHRRIYDLDEPLFFRTAALRELGGWNEMYRHVEDTDIWFRAEDMGYAVVRLPKILYKYRQTKNPSLSRSFRAWAYRLLVYNAKLVRHDWGLPDLTQQGWTRRQVLDIMWNRWRQMPYVAQRKLGCAAVIHYNSFRVDMAGDSLYPLYQLAYHMVRFPYILFWQRWQQIWKMLRFARVPYWQGSSAFSLLSRVYFLPTYKRRVKQDIDRLGGDRAALPRVSVILPIEDKSSYVRHAIKGIREQTFTNWELLVIDCGASRSARRTCKRLMRADSRIRLLKPLRQPNYWQAIDIAMQQAQGDFLCRHNIGTQPQPHYLELAVKTMDAHPYKQVLGVCGMIGEHKSYLPIFIRRRFVKPKGGKHSRRFFPPHQFEVLWDGAVFGTKRTQRWIADVELTLRARQRDAYIRVPQLLYDYDSNDVAWARFHDLIYRRRLLRYMRHLRYQMNAYQLPEVSKTWLNPIRMVKEASAGKFLKAIRLRRILETSVMSYNWGIMALKTRQQKYNKPWFWLLLYLRVLWRHWDIGCVPWRLRLRMMKGLLLPEAWR